VQVALKNKPSPRPVVAEELPRVAQLALKSNKRRSR